MLTAKYPHRGCPDIGQSRSSSFPFHYRKCECESAQMFPRTMVASNQESDLDFKEIKLEGSMNIVIWKV